MVRLTFNTPISPRHKIIFKGAMKLLSADQVKYVINPITHAENHAMKRKTVMVTNRLATQTQDCVLMVRFTFNDHSNCNINEVHI